MREKISKIRPKMWEWRGALVTAPFVCGLVIFLRSLGLLQLLELETLDRFFRWRPPEPIDSRIVLVEISESDIRKIRDWPLSDALLAELIEKLKAGNPRAIGLDIYRDFPVEPGHETLLKVFESTPNLIGIQKVIGSEDKQVSPPPVLAQLDRVGAADIPIDPDGKLRRVLLSLRSPEGQTILSLPVRLALLYLAAEGIELEVIDADRSLYGLGQATFSPLNHNDGGYVDIDAGGYQILLNFRSIRCRGQSDRCPIVPTVSISEVLADEISPLFFRDRLVLIGSTAASLNDFFFTPYSSPSLIPSAGVEVHADVASQLLSGALDGRSSIGVLPKWVEWVWIFCWSGTGAVFCWLWRSKLGAIAGMVLLGGTLTLATYGAFLAGWWVSVIPPMLALAGSAVAMTGYVAYIEGEDKQTMMNLLRQHVTPKIAEAVWRDRQQLLKEGQLMGQQMIATVVFTDIKGFTRITEKTDPQTLMTWLNDYMKAMSQAVLDFDGVVDKFIGDAVMAVFGVPIPRTTPEEIAQDAMAAVNCALDMAEKLRWLNQKWQAEGLPTAAMRVGIATGKVVAGSLGSRARLNYTIIGDSVNVAARLESYDKSFDGDACRILMSEKTYCYIQDKFPARLVGTVQLRGRVQPLQIYQLIVEN